MTTPTADTAPIVCPECGAHLGVSKLCPVCLLRMGLDVEPATEDDLPSIEGFSVLERIGRGGMGAVYRSVQTEPVEREVAIKVLRAGLSSRDVVRRFENERQALAVVDHPGVARVFDAGVSNDGRPYFVMELVDGPSVTDYCEQEGLGVSERVALFAEICDAVQYAHQKGIIHRDLKPSNVLVAEYDGKPQPKVIDFGIAKATQRELVERTLFTEAGHLIGTPEYMSPEQASLRADGVDTRSDVYSLGVLLYELLVGALPFDPVSLREGGLERMMEMIREVDPARPSTRADQLALKTRESESQGAGTQSRERDPKTLGRKLRGDLDWIVMRALEKERSRRYDSVSALAADLRRFLVHEPVTAGPPGFSYRARKFARRHPVPVAAAAVLLVTSLAFSGVLARQVERVSNERDRADLEARTSEETTDFLLGLFAANQPEIARGQDVSARDLLEEGAIRIAELEDAAVRARLSLALGEAFRTLGEYERAEDLVEQAVFLYREVQGPQGSGRQGAGDLREESPETLTALTELGRIKQAVGEYDEAEAIHDRVVQQWRALDPEDPRLHEALQNLGLVRRHLGRYEESGVLLQEAWEFGARVLGEDDPEVQLSRLSWGSNARLKGDRERAEDLFRKSVAALRGSVGNDHPVTLIAISNLAEVLSERNEFAEAEQLMKEAVAIAQRVHRGDDTYQAFRADLAKLNLEMGENQRSIEIYEGVLEFQIRVLGPKGPNTLVTMNNLAAALLQEGEFQRAQDLLSQVMEGYLEALGPDHLNTAIAHFGLAITNHNLGDQGEALYRLELAAANPYFARLMAGAPEEMARFDSLRGDSRFQAVLDSLPRTENAAADD